MSEYEMRRPKKLLSLILAFDATGALLVADDVGNIIWRVVPASGRLAAAP